MLFGGLQKMTTLDYPGVVSALVFTQGCNFRCPYCHNAQLIPTRPDPGTDPVPGVEDILAFLEKRKDVLDGLAVSGGEPCMQPDIEYFFQAVKALGYKIKLDTNGSFPEVVERLCASALLDYVAIDVKTAPDRYAPDLCGVADAGEKLKETVAVLTATSLPFEVRTTCVAPFVDAENAAAMANIVPKSVPWFFQQAKLQNKKQSMHALADSEITALIPGTHPYAQLRA